MSPIDLIHIAARHLVPLVNKKESVCILRGSATSKDVF